MCRVPVLVKDIQGSFLSVGFNEHPTSEKSECMSTYKSSVIMKSSFKDTFCKVASLKLQFKISYSKVKNWRLQKEYLKR